MKFKFKVQQYQTDAVNAIVDVFRGQPYLPYMRYALDRKTPDPGQLSMFGKDENGAEIFSVGYANPKIVLSESDLLSNIRSIQAFSHLMESTQLFHSLGATELDVEMETGTGKTYVYIKSMFELNKRYGFSKFIVVVPSIAIREGVKKTFEMTQEHFMDLYGKKARFFIYNSKKLDEIEQFSSSSSINVMIINMQAFNARGADARRIYDELDEFQSRRPIEVIAKNRPILILDEPQKMGGKATQEALLRFDPLFSMYFSATHKVRHNTVYVLDALDAFNKKLVKKIQVKGLDLCDIRGTNGYLYLQEIVISHDAPPVARVEMEISGVGGIYRDVKTLRVGDNLYTVSKNMEQYRKGFTVADVDPVGNRIVFLNGEELRLGSATGNLSETDMRRIQIRETIRSHIAREEMVYRRGIKVLSLFFIDEVAKYRRYDEAGNEVNGLYGTIFEEEYESAVKEYTEGKTSPYADFLRSTVAAKAHNGYFSIDKKGHKIDSSLVRGTDVSDDVSAYDLILKDKERLLSFEEPTRFIFSHSALREGWDNPNVFQICTLKRSDSNVMRRQEVGRGLRLCVNASGERMDATIPDFDVHGINVLTVIANDSYEQYVKSLQAELKEDLYKRPSHLSKEYFAGKTIRVGGGERVVSPREATAIYRYLIKNDYLDEDDSPSEEYKNAAHEGSFAPLPEELVPLADGIHALIRAAYDTVALKQYVENAAQSKIRANPVNEENLRKFKPLWELINRKYAFTVAFDSDKLIESAIGYLDRELYVAAAYYTVSLGEQKETIDAEELEQGSSFVTAATRREELRTAIGDSVTYDLIGKVAAGTSLTRKTAAAILKGISPEKFALFKQNPEDFISKTVSLINDKKAAMIVEGIVYHEIDGSFKDNILEEQRSGADFKDAFKAKKHIREFVFADGINKTASVERRFVERLDSAEEVVVYAKLPRAFHIPTPVGNYSPDWAILFREGMKHRFVLAETKGSRDPSELKEVESAKINCARKLYNSPPLGAVRYEFVTDYDDLLDKMATLD